MKQLSIIFITFCLTLNAYSQTEVLIKNTGTMKLNAGIITSKLAESKEFYTKFLGFGVTFENDFYLLLHTPNKLSEISFLLPNHPS